MRLLRAGTGFLVVMTNKELKEIKRTTNPLAVDFDMDEKGKNKFRLEFIGEDQFARLVRQTKVKRAENGEDGLIDANRKALANEKLDKARKSMSSDNNKE